MKIFRVLGENGEIVFQERVPDFTPPIVMEWPTPLYVKITKLEIVRMDLEEV